jgi:hypothetical protein
MLDLVPHRDFFLNIAFFSAFYSSRIRLQVISEIGQHFIGQTRQVLIVSGEFDTLV